MGVRSSIDGDVMAIEWLSPRPPRGQDDDLIDMAFAAKRPGPPGGAGFKRGQKRAEDEEVRNVSVDKPLKCWGNDCAGQKYLAYYSCKIQLVVLTMTLGRFRNSCFSTQGGLALFLLAPLSWEVEKVKCHFEVNPPGTSEDLVRNVGAPSPCWRSVKKHLRMAASGSP